MEGRKVCLVIGDFVFVFIEFVWFDCVDGIIVGGRDFC